MEWFKTYSCLGRLWVRLLAWFRKEDRPSPLKHFEVKP